MKKLYLIASFLLIDLLLSQLFLLKILENDILNAHKESFENRIFNKDYNYTFKKQVKFKSQYEGNIYTISTNDLGFRDDDILPLDRDKLYSIVIGDSFVEGVGLEYKDTIVGILNQNLESDSFKFLNAGVASYSSYIYLKKIKQIINENNDLNIKDVIVFLDKSDISDDEAYLNKPLFFKNKYPKGKFIFQRKVDFYKDLKDLSFWRFYTKQTVSGKIIKVITDKIENFFSDLKKRVLISKKLPEWFNGQIYDKGDIIINPETNQELEIYNTELSMHDFVMGAEMLIEMMGDKASKDLIKYRDEGLEWLKQSNPDIIKFITLN